MVGLVGEQHCRDGKWCVRVANHGISNPFHAGTGAAASCRRWQRHHRDEEGRGRLMGGSRDAMSEERSERAAWARSSLLPGSSVELGRVARLKEHGHGATLRSGAGHKQAEAAGPRAGRREGRVCGAGPLAGQAREGEGERGAPVWGWAGKGEGESFSKKNPFPFLVFKSKPKFK